MDYFKSDLRSKGLSEASVKTYARLVIEFSNWLVEQCEEEKDCTYNTIVSYTEDCRDKGWSQSTIQLHIEAIRKYLDYIGLDPNPARLQLRPRERQIPHHLLTEEQLRTLYNNYPMKHLRNKVVLGLIVFQALRSKEIHQLKVESINLESGQVHIEGSRKANGRILSLEAAQLLPLRSYLQSYETKELFPLAHIHYAQYYLIKQLKRLYPQLLNCRQLRASVISNWLRHHNLRQVQYMAGHRYVSSTERYERSHLEDLQRDLDEYHPNSE